MKPESPVYLGSRNFNWSLPLLNLKGRAGMDLGLTLYYNSLVWTKDGSYIKFNADLGSPAPGFRPSLPKVQQIYYDYDSGTYSQMLVTSSGGRIELRQIAPSSTIFESIDGSYTQMDVSTAPNGYVTIKTSDGTQMKLQSVSVNNEYRCTEIKDRNGNKITATYNASNGHLQTIRDTLDREITFAYNTNNNLEAIRQTWAGVSHDWATFSYGEVRVKPQFSVLLVNGPTDHDVPVLTQVSLHDGTYYAFNYNEAFGQVKQINHHAAKQRSSFLYVLQHEFKHGANRLSSLHRAT